MIKLYLDMDGVIANFHKAYRVYDPAFDRKKFRQAVMDYKIFEDLELMPNAMSLLSFVKTLGVDIEILTSMGTFDAVQGAEAKRQKLVWLAKHNINYPANFIRTKSEKAKYATPFSILIDDSIGCITPFNQSTGNGILYDDAYHKEALLQLDNIITSLYALNALRTGYEQSLQS
jgi:hypothetical protein